MKDLLAEAMDAGVRLALYNHSLSIDDFNFEPAGFENNQASYTRLELKPGPKRDQYTRLLFESIRAQNALMRSARAAEAMDAGVLLALYNHLLFESIRAQNALMRSARAAEAMDAGVRLALYNHSLSIDDFNFEPAGFENNQASYTRLELKPGPKRDQYTRLLFESIRAQNALMRSARAAGEPTAAGKFKNLHSLSKGASR